MRELLEEVSLSTRARSREERHSGSKCGVFRFRCPRATPCLADDILAKISHSTENNDVSSNHPPPTELLSII
ncbi:hypothetical protein J6590_022707 [Homalodisca vitripennis]|nr:hypothetical protein J6590_022707 [Homalodisca vitripennis]